MFRLSHHLPIRYPVSTLPQFSKVRAPPPGDTLRVGFRTGLAQLTAHANSIKI